MGNPQHLEWLLEGVESWNKRRKEEPFEPDLSEFDIHGAFVRSGKHSETDHINLASINLSKAKLVRAKLNSCSLRRGDFTAADLTDAELSSSIIVHSILTNAIFTRTLLNDAYYGKTFTDTFSGDLSKVKDLTQNQLDRMNGTQGITLPKGLKIPPDWPERHGPVGTNGTTNIPVNAKQPPNFSQLSADLAGGFEQLNSEIPSHIGNTNTEVRLRHHAAFIIKTSAAAKNSARLAQIQLSEIINAHLASFEHRPNTTPETEFLEGVKTIFYNLEIALNSSADGQTKIEHLSLELERAERDRDRLLEIINNSDSFGKQVAVNIVSNVGTAAIAGTAGYLFGTGGGELINTLQNMFGSYGTVPPPQTLPPTTGA